MKKAAAAHLHVYKYCERCNVIPNQQFGFRRNSNCEMALMSAMDFWLNAVNDDKYVGALLLDLSKALDCVPHQLRLHELIMASAGYSALKMVLSYRAHSMQ